MRKIKFLSFFFLSIILGGCSLRPTSVINPPSPTLPLVGNDKDIHGCIGSAGYTWCERKDKCLRIWEEACFENVSQEIQSLLAQKYNKPIGDVKITISKQEGDYVGGSVLFGQGGLGEGGIFLARRVGNAWEVVFDGNGSIDCNKMRQEFGFPDAVLKPNFCD
jgi:hypothetical protein